MRHSDDGRIKTGHHDWRRSGRRPEQHMKLFDLTGKVALVTGGNGGIGLAMAQGMASCGASIVIAGRDAEKAGPALASLRELGARCVFVAGDVTKKAACVKLVTDTVAEFGRLDILVNNAGTAIRKM